MTNQLDQEEAKRKRSIRALTKYHFEKKGICQRCGYKGHTEFDHKPQYDYKCFDELCSMCHRNDRKSVKNDTIKDYVNQIKHHKTGA